MTMKEILCSQIKNQLSKKNTKRRNTATKNVYNVHYKQKFITTYFRDASCTFCKKRLNQLIQRRNEYRTVQT